MPKEAFADLWKALKAGFPWEGLVKNRAKSGDFYWVRANVTPVIEDGKTTGYISIRTKPSRGQVAAAERAYSMIRAGAAGLRVQDGAAFQLGLAHRVRLTKSSIAARLGAMVALSALTVGGVLGLQFAFGMLPAVLCNRRHARGGRRLVARGSPAPAHRSHRAAL